MSTAGTSNPAAPAVKTEDDRGALPDHFPAGMKVLLVDDDLTCLSVIKRMLMKCKYEVTISSRATRALSLLRENKNAFDLILSDVYMPDMDGFKLLELVGLEMDLPVIMMSADTRFNIVMKGIRHGACDFLIKPVRMAELQNIWQHVVRRKFLDNKDNEHSGSMDESDYNRQATDDAENATAANDGTDSGKSQKKRRDSKDDEDGEFDNSDPSSSKKPRVVWSVELHQQFVNAVNQLGIDKAVPKRILELMNVPGLTRENVASHLQKFRLYLKRLSGVAQHHTALANPFCGTPPNVKMGQLGKLDFQTLAVSGQIPAQTLAALQDELLGRPHNIAMTTMDQSAVRQASMQGTNSPYATERGISFNQSQPKSQGLSSYPTWTTNTHGAMGSTSNLGGLSTAQNSDILMTMLQQQQQQQRLHPVPSDSQNLISVQPSCVVAPTQSSESFRVQPGPIFSIQDSLEASSLSASNFQAGSAVVPMTQNSVLLASQSSTSLQAGTNVVRSHSSIVLPSQPPGSSSLVTKPALLNQTSMSIPSQSLRNFQAGKNPLPINQSSFITPSQSPSTFQTDHNLLPAVKNRNINTGSLVVDYQQLPSQSSIALSTMGQGLEGNFSSVGVVNNYSAPVSLSSSVSSYNHGSCQQVRSPGGSNVFSNGTNYLMDNACNTQPNTRVSVKLPNQTDGRNLGFVGKGTCLPSRFAMDDIDSPTSNFVNSNACIQDDGFILSQDNLGFNATLQSGRCASTSMK